MRKANEVMHEFMRNLKNMKQYQGIDITNPTTYYFDKDIVHQAYSIEKNIVSTQEGEKVKELPLLNDER